MYYEERIINGVLMFRTTPRGDWQQCSIEEMSQRIAKMGVEITRLRSVLENLEVQSVRDISPGWVSVPEVEWDANMKQLLT